MGSSMSAAADKHTAIDLILFGSRRTTGRSRHRDRHYSYRRVVRHQVTRPGDG